ncbi:MAG: 16S rRNA (cytidine(1402)-2'-O)-methyltransferase [Deltaproteobacteria bacterium]|nr:16S rRNA (cytidine(1402)-2'-O)-methyltransferase [Deltaproteobacteria bacterium]
MKKGSLFVVATPIGNLEDITMRAVRVLKDAGLIAAEDTRHTKKLLVHFGIDTPLTSCHEHNERGKAAFIVEKLLSGVDVALVSDAGTPAISDPGYRLVALAIENGVTIVPIPGASAIVSLVSASGLPTDEFTFKGFLPSKEGELKKLLQGLKGKARTYVFYESPRRLRDTLEAVIETLGDIQVVIGRELTKLHEEIIRGKASEALSALSSEPKGEVTLILRTNEETVAFDFHGRLEELLSSGAKLNDAVKAVAADSGHPRSEVYKEALAIKERLKEKEHE